MHRYNIFTFLFSSLLSFNSLASFYLCSIDSNTKYPIEVYVDTTHEYKLPLTRFASPETLTSSFALSPSPGGQGEEKPVEKPEERLADKPIASDTSIVSNPASLTDSLEGRKILMIENKASSDTILPLSPSRGGKGKEKLSDKLIAIDTSIVSNLAQTRDSLLTNDSTNYSTNKPKTDAPEAIDTTSIPLKKEIVFIDKPPVLLLKIPFFGVAKPSIPKPIDSTNIVSKADSLLFAKFLASGKIKRKDPVILPIAALSKTKALKQNDTINIKRKMKPGNLEKIKTQPSKLLVKSIARNKKAVVHDSIIPTRKPQVAKITKEHLKSAIISSTLTKPISKSADHISKLSKPKPVLIDKKILKAIPSTIVKEKTVSNLEKKQPKAKDKETKTENTAIIFHVQIGSFSKQPSKKTFDGIKEVSSYNENGMIKYVSGNFKNYDDALKHKEMMKSNGFSGAFVVAFSNGKKISMLGIKK